MRHFTVEEANGLLETLRPLLEDLQRLQRKLASTVGEVREFEMLASQNGHGANRSALEPDNDLRVIGAEIQQRLDYLEELGIHLKSIESGIVDFPAEMFGREVYLCWRLGEPAVSHWHDIEAGFMGRQPL